MFYRVFAGTDVEPAPADLLERLGAEGHFRGDDRGWFQVRIVANGAECTVERYLADEPGLRTDLNSWAAWVEAEGEGPEQTRLMHHIVSSPQLFVIQDPPPALGDLVSRALAEMTGGLRQVDGLGLLAADGTVLVADTATTP